MWNHVGENVSKNLRMWKSQDVSLKKPGFCLVVFSRWNDAVEKDQKIIGKPSQAVRFCAGFLGGFLSASKTKPMHRNYEPHRPHNTETFYQHYQPTNPSTNKNTWDTQSGRPTCRSGSWQSNLLPAKGKLKFPIIAVKRSLQVAHPEYQRKTVQTIAHQEISILRSSYNSSVLWFISVDVQPQLYH